MADLRTHCQDCFKELGEDFKDVHLWLDELFKYLGLAHREFRHTPEGIEEVRKRWRDKAALAATIHPQRDGVEL